MESLCRNTVADLHRSLFKGSTMDDVDILSLCLNVSSACILLARYGLTLFIIGRPPIGPEKSKCLILA